MEHADVKQAADRGRIGKAEVLRYSLRCEAPAMDDHAEIFEPFALRSPGVKAVHIVRQPELTGDLALGVVVAADQENRNPRLAQPRHLLREKQPRIVVLPIAVIHVARDQ